MALQASNFPTTKPELTLDFANSRCLDPRITFTRASSGTYVDERGILQIAPSNVARFDHNPVTLESLGLLVEEQRTNLVTNSATFQPTSGGFPASYTVDQLAPDGSTTASRQTAAVPRTFVDYTGIANAQYTFSFYCRVISGTATFQISMSNAGSDTTVASLSGQIATTSWRRYSITGTTAGATAGARVEISSVTSGFVFWGAQLEAGAFATSYIPTTSAAVTRSADVASITGSNFSSWYRQDEGTVFVDASEPSTYIAFQAYLTFQVDSGFDEIRLWRTTNATTVNCNYVIDNVSAGQVILVSNPVANRFATSYSLGQGIAGSANGGSVATAALANIVPVTSVRIGARGNGSFYGNRTYKRIVYWSQRLPNAALQTLTSS